LKTLGYYVRRHWMSYTMAIVFMVLAVALDMLFPQITKLITNEVIVDRDFHRFYWLLAAILAIGIGRSFLGYFKEFTFDKNCITIGTEMRKDLFDHIQGLSLDYFDDTNTGELMARVKDDVDKVFNMVGMQAMLGLEVTLNVVLVLFFMFRENWLLTFLPLGCMALCGVTAIVMEKKLDKVYDCISDANAELNTAAEENIGGVRTVRAFVREKFEISKFRGLNQKYCDACINETKTFVSFYPYFQFITRVLPFLTLLLGGYIFIKGQLTLGELTAFVAYTQNIVWPMEMLGWLTNSFASAIASYKKIKKIYDEVSVVTEPENPVKPEKIEGHITFDNVSFHKEDMHDILKNISFDLPAGQTLGIMGATGSGKSSLISLLERLYDSTEGTILLDDIDIKNLSLSTVRGSISLIMQDVYLFSETISENIKMGDRENISLPTIKRAATDACANDFVEKMDEAYDTVIGERGVGLSGGQKQRLSIARAFAKERPILILDDSTSALDAETEQKIQEKLSTLTGMTKIIIGHRISAVRNADNILVLENGSIAESGTHEELLAKKGLYYETYVSQYGEPLLAGKEA